MLYDQIVWCSNNQLGDSWIKLVKVADAGQQWMKNGHAAHRTNGHAARTNDHAEQTPGEKLFPCSKFLLQDQIVSQLDKVGKRLPTLGQRRTDALNNAGHAAHDGWIKLVNGHADVARNRTSKDLRRSVPQYPNPSRY